MRTVCPVINIYGLTMAGLGVPIMSGLRVTPQQLTSLGGSCTRTATDVRGQHSARWDKRVNRAMDWAEWVIFLPVAG